MTDSAITITKTIQTIKLTGEDIIYLLREVNSIDPDYDKAKVEFMVPGGGDWSSQAIEVDEENMIHVTLKTEATL